MKISHEFNDYKFNKIFIYNTAFLIEKGCKLIIPF